MEITHDVDAPVSFWCSSFSCRTGRILAPSLFQRGLLDKEHIPFVICTINFISMVPSWQGNGLILSHCYSVTQKVERRKQKWEHGSWRSVILHQQIAEDCIWNTVTVSLLNQQWTKKNQKKIFLNGHARNVRSVFLMFLKGVNFTVHTRISCILFLLIAFCFDIWFYYCVF